MTRKSRYFSAVDRISGVRIYICIYVQLLNRRFPVSDIGGVSVRRIDLRHGWSPVAAERTSRGLWTDFPQHLGGMS